MRTKEEIKKETKIWKEELIELITDKINRCEHIEAHKKVELNDDRSVILKEYVEFVFGECTLIVDEYISDEYFDKIEKRLK